MLMVLVEDFPLLEPEVHVAFSWFRKTLDVLNILRNK